MDASRCLGGRRFIAAETPEISYQLVKVGTTIHYHYLISPAYRHFTSGLSASAASIIGDLFHALAAN